MYILFLFIHSFVIGPWDCFCLLALVNNVGHGCTKIFKFSTFSSLGHILRSRVILCFEEWPHFSTVKAAPFYMFTFFLQCIKILVFYVLTNICFFLLGFVIIILMDVKYLIVILIYIFLIINNVNPFHLLLVIVYFF